MQVVKNHCFIDECLDGKINIIIFDDNYKLIQYKLLDFDKSKLNNIYCGIVEKVEGSLDSCFVRIDEHLSGFLPYKQLGSFYYEKTSGKLINKIKKGDKILVQIIRDSLRNKNVKLSNDITLSGQFCVYMPFNQDGHGISSHIKGDQRVIFKEYLNRLKISGSIVVRSSAIEISLDDLIKDIKTVKKYCSSLLAKFAKSTQSGLLLSYNDLMYSLRSYSNVIIDKIYVKQSSLYKLLSSYKDLNLIKMPEIIYGSNFKFLDVIQKQVDNLYQKTVYLPSRGYIVIEKTEAVITIDVNSGASKKQDNMEETAFITNLEAVDVIVDQIILRNLGGIIIVDFIDLKDKGHIDQINDALKKRFKNDRASLKIVPMSLLCVVQISRERKGLSLFDKYYALCFTCNHGLVLTQDFLGMKLLESISAYGYQDSLLLQLNKSFFEFLTLEKYHKVLKKYKRLSYEFNDSPYFKIIKSNIQ